jgi:hypothetical protein
MSVPGFTWYYVWFILDIHIPQKAEHGHFWPSNGGFPMWRSLWLTNVAFFFFLLWVFMLLKESWLTLAGGGDEKVGCKCREQLGAGLGIRHLCLLWEFAQAKPTHTAWHWHEFTAHYWEHKQNITCLRFLSINIQSVVGFLKLYNIHTRLWPQRH